jgi:CPA1 family monovalent cation:H+ antiporter
VQSQLKSLKEEITQMQNHYPQLRTLAREQLQDKLLNIEADTYAELIGAGQLDNQLSPLLAEVIVAGEENLSEL